MAGRRLAGCRAAARWAQVGPVGGRAVLAGASCESLSAKQLDVCNQISFTLTKAKKPEVAASAFESVGFAVMFCEEIVVAMFSADEACEEEFIDDDEEPADLYKGSFSLTYGTVTLLRETKLHLRSSSSTVCWGPPTAAKLRC